MSVSVQTPERPTRRAFVFFGALAAAVGLSPKAARAQQIPARRKAIQRRSAFNVALPNETPDAPAAWESNVIRLVRRTTMGLTAEEVARAQQMGYQGYLNRQLNYTRIDDTVAKNFVAAHWPLLSQTGDQIYNANQGTLITQLQEATLFRAAFSQRQLYERMVEFWTDHFNISILTVGYLKLLDDRDVIRKHALGKFPDLLKASAHSTAMLAYLDQTRSRVGRPNQNYARELMELHTLGVDGGYTQDDVAELSRVLTGWTIQGRGTFYFDPTGHDWGQKTVLGMTIPAGSPSLGADGVKEGEMVLDLLVRHASTARFIATKLLRWLLTAEPDESQIRTIATVYRVTNGDIKAMVRAILNDGWIGSSSVKLKRPFHYVASALRATNPVVNSITGMNGQLTSAGQPLFYFETPDGYSDKIEYWAGNILPRWNAASVLANSNNSSIAVSVSPYLQAGTPSAALDLINTRLFGGELDPATRAALNTYIGAGTFNDARIRETLALALSSSAFQWY
jgi:uncharacterized protein (DUF1800 family)